MTIIVAPSLLAADPLHFGAEVKSVEDAGADWHHVDVMDGHFVPNLTFGLPFIAALKKVATIPLDVHIMVSNPDQVALDYVKAGADILCFHIEASTHPHRLIQAIHGAGAKAGIALNPGTPVEAVFPLLDDVDVVMVMSVNPGFGGQSFIKQSVRRIAALATELKARNRFSTVKIEVDGGITDETGIGVVGAGATALVAGTFVFGQKDRAVPIKKLKALASAQSLSSRAP